MPIAEALRLLQELHRRRNYRPVADTIGAAARRRRARTSDSSCGRPASRRSPTCCTSPSWRGSTRPAGGISFRGFIDELRSAAESEAAEAPILEESSDGVRLMTVHKAKGLEFPVVILADLTCRISRDDASRYLDRGARPVRDEDRRLGAARAARARGGGGGARPGRRRAPRLRRGDARARSAGRARRSATSRGRAAGSAR